VNARVVLERGGVELISRTDFNGRFVFQGVAPGRYRLRVTKGGFIRQEYPRSAMGAPGFPIDLAPGQELRNIVFRLDPAPTMSGVIRDDANAPVANVVVQALRRGYDARGNRTLSLTASAKTDDRGAYRIYWLDPGEYFVSAMPSPPPQNVATARFPAVVSPTYFPGFPAVDDAKPVRLELGRDANGIDFRLTQQIIGPVQGAAISLATGRFTVAAITLAAAEDAAGVARFQTRSTNTVQGFSRNNYSIPSVAPGSYILSAVSENEQASKRILVKASGLVADLELGPGVVVRGRLEIASNTATDLRASRVLLEEVDTALPSPAPVTVALDGSFVVPAVQPGYYSVNVVSLPGDLYVRTVSFAGLNVLEKPMALAYGSGDSGQLSIQIATDGGRLAGAVYDGNNALFAGAQVTLVPEGSNRMRLDHYRAAVSGPDGAFTIPGIVPGDYRLFAWENLEPNAYLNVEFMRSYLDLGTLLRVDPGQTRSVPLRLIPSEQ
jgi:hypothetical protein